MKCIIIAGGEFKNTRDMARLIKEARLLVCADSGAGHIRKLNVLPHALIGDFDSIHPDDKAYFEKQAVEFIPFPPRKDHTDSELCVSWALEKGATDITFLGATGTRMDHTLANIFMLRRLADLKIPARIIDNNNEIYLITDFIELNGTPGDLLSIIPVTKKVEGITCKGLEYPLLNAGMEMGSSLGISNIFKESTVSISIKNGMMIVSRSKD